MAVDDYGYTGVLSSEETKQKNFLVVNRSPKGEYVLSRLAVCMMVTCVALLLAGAIAATYFLTAHLVQAECTSMCEHLAAGAAPQSYSRKAKKLNVYDRLPTNVLPTHYSIKLMPFIEEGNFTTDGHVSIKVMCMLQSRNFTLNINDILIAEHSVSVCEYDFQQTECTDVRIRDHLYDEVTQTYVIRMKDTLVVGRNYTINIHFVSQLNNLLQGFYRSSYVDSRTGETRWMANTQFSPTDARRAFPCFDEPDRKARFTISIARDSRRHSSLSNMPLRTTQPIVEMTGWVWDHYEETPVMSTYLTAFMVSDLKALNGTVQGNNATRNARSGAAKAKYSVWARGEALGQTYYAYKIVPKVLLFLEQYFDIEFPLPKQDMVAVPDFGFNAMENWGLVIFRESAMLYDDKQSTAWSKQNVAQVISHELGHQWFGNLVTPAWWDDLWLKEGFATFCAYLGVNYVEPTWKILDQFVLEEIMTAYQLDALRSSHPISVPVQHADEIRQIFDTISYKKGASVIRMMFHFLGEPTFQKGLNAYLSQHAYGNAKQDDLWEALNEQAINDDKLPENITIKDIMDSWTISTGFPMVTVIRDYVNNSAVITQKRFLLTNESNVEDKTLWHIPISYTTKAQHQFNNTAPKLWLIEKQAVIENLPGKDQWIIFNLQNVGFYRVNYDRTNWELLTYHFRRFPELTRAQIINDALNIARISELKYEVALDFLKDLTKELSYMPWFAASEAISYLSDMLSFTPIYGEFRVFVVGILRNSYDMLGFEEKWDDGHMKLMHRAQILSLACKMHEDHCVVTSQTKFRKWMIRNEDAVNPIAPNLKPTVYCTSIKAGGKQEWEFMYQQYLNSNVGTDKEVMLDALGCASEQWLLSRYLNYSISGNPEIRKQDGGRIFQSVANNINGAKLAFNFLRDNWDEINAYYGDAFNTVSKMVNAVGTFLNMPSQLEELENFKDKNINNLYTTERAFNNVIEKVKGNIQWRKNSYPAVEEWLRKVNTLYGLK